MTPHESAIDYLVESALGDLNSRLEDLCAERGVTRAEVRARLNHAWGVVEAWDDWCEENPDA